MVPDFAFEEPRGSDQFPVFTISAFTWARSPHELLPSVANSELEEVEGDEGA